MPVPPVGIHSILPCAEGCGTYVRPKRMDKDVAKALVAEHFGPDAVVVINTGRAICSSCRKYPSMEAKKKDSPEAEARKEKLAEERLAAARRTREAIERERLVRQARNKVRRVSMGQSMVRI
jgi:hypothetical protein